MMIIEKRVMHLLVKINPEWKIFLSSTSTFVKRILRLCTLVLFSLLFAGTASAQNTASNGCVSDSEYKCMANAAISGHNTKPGVAAGSVAECKKLCNNESGFICKSFDYNKSAKSCDLSDKSVADIGSLKTDYANNPYDHYERLSVNNTVSKSEPLGINTTDTNIKMVAFNNGAFVQQALDRWVEVGKGKTTPSFTFNLKQKTADFISLYDAGRKIEVVLVIEPKEIWVQQGDAKPFKLANITSVSETSKLPWMPQKEWYVSETQSGGNEPAFILDGDVYAQEEQLSGDLVEVTVSLYAKETEDFGEDEIYWKLTSPTGKVYRRPTSGSRDMDEDDTELERWSTKVNAQIDPDNPDKTFNLKVYEEDSPDPDDVLFDVSFKRPTSLFAPGTLQHKKIEFDFEKSTYNYKLNVSVKDRRLPAKPAVTPIQDLEKSPTVKDVVTLLRKVSGRASTVVDTEIDGISDKWSKFVENGDHLQGIAMTPSGRLAINMSLSNEPGIFAYSNSIFDLSSSEELTWKFLQKSDRGSELWDPHPSAMASTGNIIVTSNRSKHVRFIYLPTSNNKEAVHLDYLDFRSRNIEAVGIAYHKTSDRFYLAVSDPGVTPSDEDSISDLRLYRSKTGLSLLDNTNEFSLFKTVRDVPVSGQGISMLVEDSGDIYIASNFSSDGEPATEDYVTVCSQEYLPGVAAIPLYGQAAAAGAAIAVAVQADKYPFTDILTVSKIGSVRGGKVEFSNTASVVIDKKELGRTQDEQLCVMHRPAWRFAGSIVPTNNNELTALWGGRWNMIAPSVSDNLEYAYQRVD